MSAHSVSKTPNPVRAGAERVPPRHGFRVNTICESHDQ